MPLGELARELEHRGAEGGVPLSDLALAIPRDRDALGAVEDREQRNATDRVEVLDEGARQALDTLVGNERHLDPAGVLEPRGEKVEGLFRAVEEVHVDVAEVVLRELARQSPEPHHGARAAGSQLGDEAVEGRLAPS